ncbi:stage 0 sporulation protein B (sporulation initiation phosphotransferase) [Halobacillus alkaliphilus]|uniref:Stage 0 sporulation protein B (Sporulation initiation phosphotransferase) n=1 Tax=Halobacillus alkaliphilus TaxID=396056 RepID=A0A1I2JDV9_9BACI|nr:Spo0B domain-containing protein [Halobacillus alkaliphilus]SFF52469.1 stage 0 sporulation protein B (sporulation initiation phosphotransferase) [Halobacillus alkaliphilus]
MDDKEIITLLRHKRHDWMNQIQLLQGYASLGKQERLFEQIDDIKEEAENERRILNSDAVAFPIWLISFNWKYDYYRIKYSLSEEVDLSRHDQKLTAYGERMIELMNDYRVDDELYEGTVQIYKGIDEHSLGLSWEWDGRFRHTETFMEELNQAGFIATILEERELSIEMMVD